MVWVATAETVSARVLLVGQTGSIAMGVVSSWRMVDPWREFDLAVCRWIVKLVSPEELPDAAVTAMVAGCDTPSLARLAGMDGATGRSFRRSWRRCPSSEVVSCPHFRRR
jgi:hypothetical protein